MNKNIDEKSYKEASYGRKQLMTVSIIVFIVSLILVAGGIALFVFGVKANGWFGKTWRIAIAIVLLFLGGTFGYASFMAFWTSTSMLKNNSMNVKDGNRAKDTLNILKCDKCGAENEKDAEFCKNCGASMKDYIECECGTRNPLDSEFCKNCGKSLKK